jgi:formylmethanofuran:tetrahydromethanopterin formyltransferase
MNGDSGSSNYIFGDLRSGTRGQLGFVRCHPTAEESAMSDLTRDEVLAAVHPVDDATIAEIIATGVDRDELVQACRFYAKDRTVRTPEDVPRGRVGRVVSILERAEAEVKESWLREFGSTLQ